MAVNTRKKAAGQVDRLVGELERNPLLEQVFSICLKLGIDDPIHWMNNVSPVLITWWTAYLYLVEKRKVESMEDKNEKMTPEEAGDYLFNLSKGQSDGR